MELHYHALTNFVQYNQQHIEYESATGFILIPNFHQLYTTNWNQDLMVLILASHLTFQQALILGLVVFSIAFYSLEFGNFL